MYDRENSDSQESQESILSDYRGESDEDIAPSANAPIALVKKKSVLSRIKSSFKSTPKASSAPIAAGTSTSTAAKASSRPTPHGGPPNNVRVGHILPQETDGKGEDDDEDDGSNSRSSSSSRLKTTVALDDEGDPTIVDPGKDMDQELIDHAKYWRLAERLDEDGGLPLVNAAYEEEAKTASSYMADCTLRNWQASADEVLATMNADVLKAICTRDGNLAQLNNRDPAVTGVIKRYAERGEKQPTVYVRCLTLGAARAALTVHQANDLSQHALHYASQVAEDAPNANEIDKAIDKKGAPSLAQSVKGYLRYLQTGTKDIDPSRKRRLMTFSRVLTKNVQECIAQGRMMMPVMQYVGYAKNVKVRSKQHDKRGDSSNWLCIFAMAVLRAMGFKPQVELFTVCLISEEWDGPVAEMLLTRLARAYYFAGDFSTAQAGASMASIKMSNLTDAGRNKAIQSTVPQSSKPMIIAAQ